ncbi:MAG: hypothetical protein ACERKV_09470 [Clostridiaceae bacterium]
MDNNKNRKKNNDLSNSEKRKMFPKDGGDIGIANGEKIDANNNKFTKRSKLSHNR